MTGLWGWSALTCAIRRKSPGIPANLFIRRLLRVGYFLVLGYCLEDSTKPETAWKSSDINCVFNLSCSSIESFVLLQSERIFSAHFPQTVTLTNRTDFPRVICTSIHDSPENNLSRQQNYVRGCEWARSEH